MREYINTRCATLNEYKKLQNKLSKSPSLVNAIYHNPKQSDVFMVYNEDIAAYCLVTKDGEIIPFNKQTKNYLIYPVIDIKGNLTSKQHNEIKNTTYYFDLETYEEESEKYKSLVESPIVYSYPYEKGTLIGHHPSTIYLTAHQNCFKPVNRKTLENFINYYLIKEKFPNIEEIKNHRVLYHQEKLNWIEDENILISPLPFSIDAYLNYGPLKDNFIEVKPKYNFPYFTKIYDGQFFSHEQITKLYKEAEKHFSKTNIYKEENENEFKEIFSSENNILNLYNLNNKPIVIDSKEDFIFKSTNPYLNLEVFVKPAWYEELIKRCNKNKNLVTPVIFRNFLESENLTKKLITDIATTGIILGNFFLPPNSAIIINHNNEDLINFLKGHNHISFKQDDASYLSIIYSPNKKVIESKLIDSINILSQVDNYITLTTGIYTVNIPQENENFKQNKSDLRKEIDLEFKRQRTKKYLKDKI